MKYIKVINEVDKVILVNIKKVKSFKGINDTVTCINFKKGDYLMVKVKVDDFGIAIRKFNEGYKGVVVIDKPVEE